MEYNKSKMTSAGPALGSKGVMAQTKVASYINPCAHYDASRMRYQPMDYRGTPRQAFEYKY